ncbi:MAG: ComF family protein [Lachnospiraceae bacterium]
MIYPRRCSICDDILEYGKKDICNDCKKKIKYIKEPYCIKCGKSLKSETEYCYDCMRKFHYFNAGRAIFEWSSIKNSIYKFKYHNRQEYVHFYGKSVVKVCGKHIKQWNPDAIIAVPIHKKRHKKRGFNQAQLLANEIGKYTNIPVYKNFVIRQRNTKPLKNMDPVKRQNNLKKAFKIVPNDVKLNTILVIDDIYTTGSTIDAIAKECKLYGIKEVYFITLAIGEGL